MGRIRRLWFRVRDSFWGFPLALVLLAIVVAYLLVGIDSTGLVPTEWLSFWLWADGIDEARAVSTSIAAAAISTAGVTFSITMVVLTLAASQLGPRLLRNFTSDRKVQFTLGTLLATFVYSLILLRAMGTNDDGNFVPHLAVSINMGLALLAIGTFILFIAHVVTDIQAPRVIERVGLELDEAIRTTYPAEGRASDDAPPQRDPDAVLASRSSGFFQQFDHGSLLPLCSKHQLQLRVLRTTGEYILHGAPLLEIWREEGAETDDDEWLSDELEKNLLAAVIISSQRLPVQDVTFAMNQLAEIAIRALSPGINDPFTAMNALNRLADGLNYISRRGEEQLVVCEDDEPRLFIQGLPKADTVGTAFNTVREYAASSHLLTRHVLSLIDRLLPRVDNEPMRDRLGEEARLYADIYLATSPVDSDKQPIERLINRIADRCESIGESNTDEGSDYGTAGD